MRDETNNGHELHNDKISRLDAHKAALKYYEMHVTHRAHILNFLLVIVSAAAISFTTAFKTSIILAGIIAITTSAIISIFWVVQYLTLNKIKASKFPIYENNEMLEEVFECNPKLLCLSDSTWKSLIYFVLLLPFFFASVYCFPSIYNYFILLMRNL